MHRQRHGLVELLLTPSPEVGTTTAAFTFNGFYAPQSIARARILLLLLDAGGGPVSISAFYDALPECSRECVRKALSWLWQRGVLRRLGRGFYSLEPAYLQFLSELRHALEQMLSQKSAILTSKEGDINVKKVTPMSPSVTSRKESELAEKVKREVKRRYGDELDETDLLIIETLARKYEETGSWYVEDNEGVGLAEQLRGWMRRLGLCQRSSSIGGGGRSCPSLSELADSLRRLADAGIIYVNRRYRKMRLNRRLVERALHGGGAYQ